MNFLKDHFFVIISINIVVLLMVIILLVKNNGYHYYRFQSYWSLSERQLQISLKISWNRRQLTTIGLCFIMTNKSLKVDSTTVAP